MNKRILCVDDEVDLLETLQDFLEVQKYTVVIAQSGKQALDITESSPVFDLILCDIAMPEMDGLAFLKMLRANPRYTAVPFIFMTALSHNDDMVKAHRLGCDEYLVKPVDFGLLDTLVASRLERSELINCHYNEPQQAFQQLMLNAFADEMMEPTNAIVSTASSIMQMLEGTDELLERRFSQVFQSATQQLSMLQQMSLLLRNSSESRLPKMADYPCKTDEICTHVKRLLQAHQLDEYVAFIDRAPLRLMCDPFLISKAIASLLSREVRWGKERKMQLTISCDEQDGGVRISLCCADSAEDSLLACPVEGYTDCALFQRALKGRVVSVMFFLDIAKLHQANFSLLVEEDQVFGYRITFPAERTIRVGQAV